MDVSSCPRCVIASAAAAAVLFAGGAARAQENARPNASVTKVAKRTSATPDRAAERPAPVRVGVLGGIGFPRPLAIDGLVIVRGWLAVGAEYGALPPITVADVRTSLWSLAVDARVFPFAGPFFAGVRLGHQHVEASATIGIPRIGPTPEALTLDSWFVNPRIGILWASHSGIAFGTEAGVQFPIGPSLSSTVPLSLVPSAQSAADSLGSSPIPTVDVFRVGGFL
jgi:hypothetical protein